MNIHVCMGIRKNCWNLYDSYGEICVHCGCCSDDQKVRAESRLAVAKEHLQEQLDFNRWSDDQKLRAIQEKNRKANIRHYRGQVKYYTKRVEELNKDGEQE